MPTMSDRQLDIIRHALGYPEMFRNYFCTGPGSVDFADCEKLSEAGFMVRRNSVFNEVDEEYIYNVTEEGKKALYMHDPRVYRIEDRNHQPIGRVVFVDQLTAFLDAPIHHADTEPVFFAAGVRHERERLLRVLREYSSYEDKELPLRER